MVSMMIFMMMMICMMMMMVSMMTMTNLLNYVLEATLVDKADKNLRIKDVLVRNVAKGAG